MSVLLQVSAVGRCPLMEVPLYIPYIKVMPGYFLSFEALVLFAQASDEGN